MNVWQGTFPGDNTLADGFYGTCPVDAFEPNGYGLHNTTGNVWEWCADWFSPDFHTRDRRTNPVGPGRGTHRASRGGSYLCHASYCRRYRVTRATRPRTPRAGTSVFAAYDAGSRRSRSGAEREAHRHDRETGARPAHARVVVALERCPHLRWRTAPPTNTPTASNA